MNTSIWITAIIPTYNRSVLHLSNAINSIKNQTYNCIDIIIIDDNEHDSIFSDEIKDYCKSQNLTYVKNIGHKGACSARNLGISLAKGDYIAFLDDDDEWLPTKIEKQIEYIADSNVLIYCNGWRKDIRTTPSIINYYRNPECFKTSVSFFELLQKNYIGTTSQFLIKKECLEQINGFDENMLARQDYDLCLRLSQLGVLVGINEPLFIHNIHTEEQISKSSLSSLKAYKYLYKKYKNSYDFSPTAKSCLFFKISRMERLQNHIFDCMKYYIKGVTCSPTLWKHGLKEIKSSKTV